MNEHFTQQVDTQRANFDKQNSQAEGLLHALQQSEQRGQALHEARGGSTSLGQAIQLQSQQIIEMQQQHSPLSHEYSVAVSGAENEKELQKQNI